LNERALGESSQSGASSSIPGLGRSTTDLYCDLAAAVGGAWWLVFSATNSCLVGEREEGDWKGATGREGCDVLAIMKKQNSCNMPLGFLVASPSLGFSLKLS
jgi:hypothetical protein